MSGRPFRPGNRSATWLPDRWSLPPVSNQPNGSTSFASYEPHAEQARRAASGVLPRHGSALRHNRYRPPNPQSFAEFLKEDYCIASSDEKIHVHGTAKLLLSRAGRPARRERPFLGKPPRVDE